MMDTPPSLRAALVAAVAALAALPVLAAEVALSGSFTQGGLVSGAAAGAVTATLDGQRVPVEPGGRFVFGFGRDAGARSELVVRFADGLEEVRVLAVAARTYAVQRIDGLPAAQVSPPAEVLARIDAENARIVAARAIETPQAWYAGGFRWPVRGRISGVYGSRRILNGEARAPHYGLDIAAAAGTPIQAPASGIVTLAEDDLYFTGGTVILDHGAGISSTFQHLSVVGVEAGDFLEAGDVLGLVGATGRVTGPHLHWAVNWFEVRLDPALLVPPQPEG